MTLTRKQMEKELMKRYGTTNIWFVDWNWSDDLQNLDNDQIHDLYNKKGGQYKDFKVLVARDLRRNSYNDLILIVTRRNFKKEVYYERQWDPAYNEAGFRNGLELNSYKDSGDIVRVNEDTVIEELDGVYYIQENYHTCPVGHVFE